LAKDKNITSIYNLKPMLKRKRKNKGQRIRKSIFMLIAVIFIVHSNINAQTKAQIAHFKKKYHGTWVNKKDKRYLRFFFDEDAGYITINDWTGNLDRNKSNTIDAYKAFIKGNKLIIPAEHNDHHSPYCEIEIVNKKLFYRCNPPLNFTDNVLVKGPYSTQKIFERWRE